MNQITEYLVDLNEMTYLINYEESFENEGLIITGILMNKKIALILREN